MDTGHLPRRYKRAADFSWQCHCRLREPAGPQRHPRPKRNQGGFISPGGEDRAALRQSTRPDPAGAATGGSRSRCRVSVGCGRGSPRRRRHEGWTGHSHRPGSPSRPTCGRSPSAGCGTHPCRAGPFPTVSKRPGQGEWGVRPAPHRWERRQPHDRRRERRPCPLLGLRPRRRRPRKPRQVFMGERESDAGSTRVPLASPASTRLGLPPRRPPPTTFPPNKGRGGWAGQLVPAGLWRAKRGMRLAP